MTTASDSPARITQSERYLAALRGVIAALRAKRNGTTAPPRARDRARLLADAWDLQGFDPTKHPRHDKGVREGGRFRRKDEAGTSTTDGPTTDDTPSIQNAEAMVGRLADEMRFPKERIAINPLQGPEFTVGADQYRAAGFYHPDTDTITLHANAFKDGVKAAEPLVAHEIQHARYRAVLIHGLREFLSDPANNKWLTPTDELTPEGAKRFKTIARVMAAWGKGEAEEFLAEDGVTDYSTSYWKAYEVVRNDIPIKRLSAGARAINETLAEIAAVTRRRGGVYPAGKPKLVELYKAIVAAYTGHDREKLGLPPLKV